MGKPSLIVLLFLIGLRGYSQPELENALNAAAKIVCLDVATYKNSLVDRTVGSKELDTLKSYYLSARLQLVGLERSGNQLYIKRGLFLDILLESELAIVYAWANDNLEVYDRLKKIIADMDRFYNDPYLFPFRFNVGTREYEVQKDDFKLQLIKSYEAIGVASYALEKWDDSKLYWRRITKLPGVTPERLYDTRRNLIIIIKEYLHEEDIELVDIYLENFRMLCDMKYKDRHALKNYVDPNRLFDSAKALSDRHPEFERSREVESTGAKGFYDLGEYAKSGVLFTKWLEGGVSSDPLSCYGISVGIHTSDTKLVNLAIKNLEKGFWGEYCFAFNMLKEGYEFLGNKKKARYWKKKDDKCMGR